ncbi:hypothetical protein A3L23_04904 (plasmid) [Rhodococcoides fascians D188]|uniref:Uncharacterized protein n=1 Tax=Rhodococcoides fascians D188 TaxID=1051973 RepID=G8JYQ8_RHOFA|nr:hypothetical protein pFi_043 [Rhodococcus fascians D188]AMY56202.1 hypothetical protein A3L23_04904 [Rhodococcus fascians D188]
MSPVSKKRKGAGKGSGRSRSGPGAAALPEWAQRAGYVTPPVAGIRPPANPGVTAPAEVQIIDRHCQIWQAYTEGGFSGTCIAAVRCLIPALRDYGIEAEPLVVYGQVAWSDEQWVELGSRTPKWESDTWWTGHLVLWIPAMGRIVDPTVYQANRRGMPTTITRALVFSIGSLDLMETAGVNKDGALVQYERVIGADMSWFDRDHADREAIEDALRILRSAVSDSLGSKADRKSGWMETATHPPLVEALRLRGLISAT